MPPLPYHDSLSSSARLSSKGRSQTTARQILQLACHRPCLHPSRSRCRHVPQRRTEHACQEPRSEGSRDQGLKACSGGGALTAETFGRTLEALEVCRRLSPSAPSLSAEDATRALLSPCIILSLTHLAKSIANAAVRDEELLFTLRVLPSSLRSLLSIYARWTRCNASGLATILRPA